MNGSECPAEIRALYDDYLADIAQKEAKRKLGAGLFGSRGGVRDDPCHERFAGDVEAALGRFAGEDHTPEEIRALLEYIYFSPESATQANSAYWMLLAVHRLTGPLVSALPTEDAAALAERYDTVYPRRARLPVQDEVLDTLRERAGLKKRKGKNRIRIPGDPAG